MALRPPRAASSSPTRLDDSRPALDNNNSMNVIKLFCLTLVNLVRQVPLLPRAAVLAFQQRRARIDRRAFEVERLDRIRNPSNYAGR